MFITLEHYTTSYKMEQSYLRIVLVKLYRKKKAPTLFRQRFFAL